MLNYKMLRGKYRLAEYLKTLTNSNIDLDLKHGVGFVGDIRVESFDLYTPALHGYRDWYLVTNESKDGKFEFLSDIRREAIERVSRGDIW